VRDRQVVVGVTGGIAAYKTAELVRLLVKEGARVRVGMTENATRFVSPLVFEAISGNQVIWDMWNGRGTPIDHITWGQGAELIIIAPATANFVAKMAHGIADDFLSTMVVAATAKILVCPSMNSRMLAGRTVQENLERLRAIGLTVMEPGKGDLVCRSVGPGRLPEPEDILEHAGLLTGPGDLSGLRFLVTAGPTLEPIDTVRFIGNRSSGKMGYALARAARRRGASVILVSGPTALKQPFGVEFCPVKTAEEMRRAVLEHRAGCDVIIKAAAVSDYRAKDSLAYKIKKGPESLSIEMARNPDILAELGSSKEQHPCLLVGFAAETEDLVVNAREKLLSKNLDLIVANDVAAKDAGFETDQNRVKIIGKDGGMEECPLMSKEETADRVLDRIKGLLNEEAR